MSNKKYNPIEGIKSFLSAKGCDGFVSYLDKFIAENDLKVALEDNYGITNAVDNLHSQNEQQAESIKEQRNQIYELEHESKYRAEIIIERDETIKRLEKENKELRYNLQLYAVEFDQIRKD